MSLHEVIKRFNECNVDRRAGYYRYRQLQLVALHNGILARRAELARALVEDCAKTDFEAQLELLLTLKTLQEQSGAADFATLSERKKVLREGGTAARPLGAGLIIGHDTAPLYSTVGALGAAILAGNVAICMVPGTCERVYNVLQEAFKAGLDHDAYPALLNDKDNASTLLRHSFSFYILSSSDQEERSSIVQAAQQHDAKAFLLPKRSPSKPHNICVVTTSCPTKDLYRAANLIARAKLCATSGRGLAALSFVAVHESLHDQLFKLVVDAYKELLSGMDVAHSYKSVEKQDRPTRPAGGGDAYYSFGGTGKGPSVYGNVAVDSPSLNAAVPPSCLFLVPYTSTEEALNLLSANLGDVLSVFGNQLECDYYHIETTPNRMLVNDWNLEYLVGLALTDETAGGDGVNWTPSVLETCSKVTPASGSEQALISPSPGWQRNALQAALFPSGLSALKVRRKPHVDKVKRIFFLQGYHFMVNAGYTSSAIVLALGSWFAYRRWAGLR